MSNIKGQVASLTDAKNLNTKPRKGNFTLMFGFRLRNNGFTMMATPAQVASMQANAKEAYRVLGDIWKTLDKLEDLGKQAENNANRAVDDAKKAEADANAWAKKAETLGAEANKLRAASDADPDNEGKAKAADKAADAANAAGEQVENANKRNEAAGKRYEEAQADIKAVNAGIDKVKKTIEALAADIGKQMGLGNVFIEEFRRDSAKEAKSGKIEYSTDLMSFSEKSSALLTSWATTFKNGAAIGAQEKSKIGTPEALVNPINPLTRQAFSKTKIEESKQDLDGKKDVPIVRTIAIDKDEVIVALNLGAIAMYRRLLQSMMERIIESATRRYA